MEYAKFIAHFKNHELQSILWGDAPRQAGVAITRASMVSRLIATPPQNQNRIFQLFADVMQTTSDRFLREDFRSELKKELTGEQAETANRLLVLFPQQDAADLESSQRKLQSLSLNLSKMDAFADTLEANNLAIAEEIYDAIWQIVQATASNPECVLNPKIDANLFINEVQTLSIGSLPTSIQQAQDYFQALLKAGCKVFVSLHEIEDAKSDPVVASFWTKNALSRMTTPFLVKEEKVLVGSKSHPEELLLFETTLESGEGIPFTHIHFKGWKDRSLCPDIELLHKLHDRLIMLSPEPRRPIAFNCLQGLGRSASAACTYFLRRKYEQLRLKEADVAINVAETIVALRLVRKNVLKRAYYLPFLLRFVVNINNRHHN